MTTSGYGVRYAVYAVRGNSIESRERFFRTSEARARFLDGLEERGRLHEVQAYCDPEPMIHLDRQ